MSRIKKRCTICGKTFYTNSKTCSRQCGFVLQRESCDNWWKKNKKAFSEKLREIKKFSTIRNLQ